MKSWLVASACVGLFLSLPSGGIIAAQRPSATGIAAQAEKILDATATADGPGIAVLVGRGDDVLFRRTRGMAQIELGVPLSADQVFRIGSNTKQFTAVAILKLTEQGRLSLTDSVSKFLPDYPNGAHITIHELLNHTSGIKDYTEIDGYFRSAIREDLDTKSLLAVFKDLPVDFAPGTDWKYDNSGYLVLGAIIEKISGKSWHEAMRELALAPLALPHTRFGADQPVIAGRVTGYTVDDRGHVANAPYISMTQAGAAGGLLSTVDDLFHWMRALHTGKLLRADSYRRLITPVPGPSGQPADYAYGLSVLKVRTEQAFEGDGRIPGFMSTTLYLPASAVAVVVLTNTDTPRADLSVVAAKLAAIALGRPYPVRHPVALSAAQMHSLVGVYQRASNGRRIVIVRDGQLYTQRSGGAPHLLHAASADELYFDEVFDHFTVLRDATGNVVRLEEFADDDTPALRLPKLDEAVPPDGLGSK
ncbi:MAG: serine hydrolase domain-containing protein [Saprospiraceae bacterium]